MRPDRLKGASVPRILAPAVLAFALAAGLSLPARGELAKWDQEKVAALAKQLNDAANNLYSTFYKQPPPQAGSGQSTAYRKLKQKMRRIQMEARELDRELAKGDSREDSQDVYDNLMQLVRDASIDARSVFTTADVQNAASTARQILNQISPYYDPDAQPLQSQQRTESVKPAK